MEKLTKGHIYEPKRIDFNSDVVYVLPKLNGLRVAYRGDGLYSYDNKRYSEKVHPELCKLLYQIYRKFKLVLDGELYVHGWPLQRINAAGAVNRKVVGAESHLLHFHVFDVVMDAPFGDRYEKYRAIIKWVNSEYVNGFKIKAVSAIQVEHKSEADSLYQAYLNQGYEGTIYRVNDVKYEFGRQWHVLKRKDWLDSEFRIVDALEENDKHGKPKGRMGALVCKTKEGKRFSVGTGFSALERVEYWNSPPIGEKLKVKYLTLSDAGIPLNLSSLGIREQA